MSTIFNLNWADIGKAVLLAFIGGFITSVYAVIQTGAFPTLAELGAAAMVGVTGAIAYLVKNFFTNSQGTIAKAEPK